MADSCDLYTIGSVMEKVVVHANSGEASGHEGESGLDHNLDTYYQPDSNGAETIDLDLGSAKTVDGLALWIKDYDTDHSATDVELHYSDNGTDFTSCASAWTTETYGANGVPLKIFPAISESAHRYWRIETDGKTSITFKISQIFLFLKRSVSIGNAWPEQDADSFHNKSQRAANGRMITTRANRTMLKRIPRSWQNIGQTDLQALQNAFNDSFGSAFPLIFKEGSNQYCVKIREDDFIPNQVAYQVYSPHLTLEELPYIEDGESY